MKYVILSLTEAAKTDFAGAENLTKSDHIVLLYVKGKKTISAALSETLDGLKATVDFVEIAQTSDLWLQIAYLVGFHTGSRHETFVITKDKDKLPSKIMKDAKVYTSFKSVASSSGTTTKKATAKKSTTSTAKKTTTKKTSTAKKKKDEVDMSDLVESLASGNTKKTKENLAGLAGQLLKNLN